MAMIPPNQTIHFGNLNSKINPVEIRSSLYNLCISYGRILDIIPPLTKRMRGQAFVAFRDISSATIAKQQLNGFEFYSKPMRVNYAKSKSDAVSKLDGTYFSENLRNERLKARRMAGKNKDKTGDLEGDQRKHMQSDDEAEYSATKKAKTMNGNNENDSDGSSDEEMEEESEEESVENNTLFVQNLPTEQTEESISELFQRYPGFVQVRRIPGKPELAFVDFQIPSQATTAKNTLDGFKFTPENSLKISFAK
ncbi:hypothetical protein BB559_007176 [Furculomyces boomerangus]|uniref:RRM domain-containing protein n=2 Tax=Harpellales TaxID=61421 RepID=A0A2T9XYH5_9FUNG|nr:hypothetical protein BB559_007176 [Furculomyces boomerangus]PVZ99929.1 hypothetical protein BB558_004043 [Smittium angustum]